MEPISMWLEFLGIYLEAKRNAANEGVISAADALAADDLGWGLCGRWNIHVMAAVVGLAYVALVEHAALATGRWSYTERMPVVSLLGAGLLPLPQMTLLPLLTFLFARWWAGRSATKGIL